MSRKIGKIWHYLVPKPHRETFCIERRWLLDKRYLVGQNFALIVAKQRCFTMRDNKVQAVTRAAQLITLIADHQAGISIGRLATETGLHKSTVSRLVMTLEASGVVQRAGKQGQVQIHPDFAQRLNNRSPLTDLRRITRPFLEDLSTHFREAASLAVPENDQAVFATQVSPNRNVQVRDWSGSRYPLHTCSPGKIFLAHRSPTERDSYLAHPLAAYTKNTDTDPTSIRRSCAEIRQTGISWIFEEFAEGLSAVAAPLFSRSQTVIGALVVFAPSYRFPDHTKIEKISLVMHDFATRCSSAIQSQGI